MVGVSDDEEDEEGSGDKGPRGAMGPGSNEYVNVIGPEEGEGRRKGEVPRGEHTFKRDAVTALHKKYASSLKAMEPQPPTQESGAESTDTFLTAEEEEELKIPGSFDMSNPRPGRGSQDKEDDVDDEEVDTSWTGLFRKLGLKT